MYIVFHFNRLYEHKAIIKAAAKKIQADSEVLVVIGIGGSYLGARAAIEFLQHSFYNELPKEARQTPQILFAGNSYILTEDLSSQSPGISLLKKK